MTKIFGAVCTYRRPDDLRVMLDAIERQTRRPDHLIVIDNDADPRVSKLVAAHSLATLIPVETLSVADNAGPAGAFALAFEQFNPIAGEDDVFAIFDDDDPPPSDTLLADLLAVVEESFVDPRVAGVGLRGGVLDTRTGFIQSRPCPLGESVQASDHLHGGWFPCYRFSALARVNDFDPSFFWGFEELELGRRLITQGYELRVASDVYFAAVPGAATAHPRRRLLAGLQEPSWRHFYRHRNLIRVLRRDRALGALIMTIGGRLLLKPLLFAPRNPRRALWHLRTNYQATREAFQGELSTPKHPAHLPA